jgi:hypothetical protein
VHWRRKPRRFFGSFPLNGSGSRVFALDSCRSASPPRPCSASLSKAASIQHPTCSSPFASAFGSGLGIGSSASDNVPDLGSGSPSSLPSPGSLGSRGLALGSSITSLMRPWIAPTTRHLSADGTGEGLE